MSYINPMALYGIINLSFPLQKAELEVVRQKLLAKSGGRNGMEAEQAKYNEIETLLFKIEIPSYQELFYKLWRDKPLHSFLELGDLDVLRKENIAHSTKSKAYFKFWKPFFLWRYNIELAKAYFEKDISQLKKLQELPFACTKEEKEKAFKDLKVVVDKDLRKLDAIEIDTKESILTGTELMEEIRSVVNLELINGLPKELTSNRSVFAYRLLELSMIVYNQQQDFDTATSLLEISLEIDVALDRREDLMVFSNQLTEYINTANQLAEYSSEIRTHLKKLKEFQILIERIDKKNISTKEVIKLVEPGAAPQKVKYLPARFYFFADEYAKALRIFSAFVWNNTGDEGVALKWLTLSEELPLSEQQAEQLEKDKASLLEKIEKREHRKLAESKPSSPRLNPSASTSNEWSIVIGSVVFLAFMLALIGNWDRVEDFRWRNFLGADDTRIASRGVEKGASDKKNKNSTRERYTTKEEPLKRGEAIPFTDPQQISEVAFPIVESRLMTGDSPYDTFYGKGRFSDMAQSRILIKNSSGLDAVICLEERGTGKTIRNEYVRADDQFKISNIPEGYYTIKTFYGRNWDENRPFQDGNVYLEGGFTESFFFKKPDGGKRYWETYDLNLDYASYEINLTPVALSISEGLEPVNGGLLSWNLRDFGQTKDAEELQVISQVVKNFDLVAIQEVVAGPGGAQAVALLVDELNRTGAKWDYGISPPTKSPLYKTERYAFLWKTGKVKKIGSLWLENSLSKEIYREPYLARFRMGKDTFLIANYHSRSSREKPEEELKYLFQLPDEYPKDRVIIAGDFNIETSAPIFRTIYGKGYMSSPNFLKTTLKTQCDEGEYLSRAIDHIFYPFKTMPQSGVIDFVGSCDQLVLGRQISDHLPVWVQIGPVDAFK